MIPRIKVIRIEGQQYYNASTPVNMAIKKATNPIIMKLDVDYVINPYGNSYDLINIITMSLLLVITRRYKT